MNIKRYILYNSRIWILSLMLVFASSFALSQTELVNIKDNCRVYFAPNSLIYINGGLNNGADAELNVNGNVSLSGDWVNDGNQTAGLESIVTFFGNNTSTIYGNGQTRFVEIILNKHSRADELRLNTLLTAVPDGFLTLSSGTFRIIGSYAFSNTFLKNISGSISIPFQAGFWLDNANVSVNAQSGNLVLRGLLKVSNGVFNVGNSGENSLIYDNQPITDPLNPAELLIDGGQINIWSRLSSDDIGTFTKRINYKQSGGLINIGYGAGSTNLNSMFEINADSSIFAMSAGTIQLMNPSSGADVNEYSVLCDSGNVSGGILRIDGVAVNQTYNINSELPIANLELSGNNDSKVVINSNSLTVLNDVTLSGSGADIFDMNNYSLTLGGDWINNLDNAEGFSLSTQPVIFIGDITQRIQGTMPTVFQNLTVDKSGDSVLLDNPTIVNGELRLTGLKSIIDMQTNDLTIGPAGNLYSGLGNDTLITAFNVNRCIINTGSDSDPLLGAYLVKKLPLVQPINNIKIEFPLGTSGVFTPAEIIIRQAGGIVSANADVSVKVVPLEHPGSELPGRALKKYWNVRSNNIEIFDNGADVVFYYDETEVFGTPPVYEVLLFSPEWDNPEGYWRVNPGGNGDDYVEFNIRTFFSPETDTIDGDWTAGEPEVARAIYYSIADGNWEDNSTWSKEGFSGTVSSTIPNKRSDKVRIQGRTVTLNSIPAPATLISVENEYTDGIEYRAAGKLVIKGENYVRGDTLRVQDNASLYMGSAVGIAPAPLNAGNVRTLVRDFSEEGKYGYVGVGHQITGTGIPNLVQDFIVQKPDADTLFLVKHIAVSDTLRIESGKVDLSSYSINGNSTGKKFIMNGGELIIRSSFPTNYTAPTFAYGKITFEGTGNSTVPSAVSSPGVAQYNDLKIAGSARTGNVVFQGLGEIKIGGALDISELNFTNNTFRFYTDGSTVRFNKQSGDQLINFIPAAPTDSVVNLSFFKLILDGAGNKIITANRVSTFKVLNNFTITNNANFISNGFNIEVQGNWDNLSGTFVAGASSVIMRSPVANMSTYINSRSLVDNAFNNLRIDGAGKVLLSYNLMVNGNIIVANNATLYGSNDTIQVKGNWINLGGTFNADTSTVIFNGTSTQAISKISGNATFNNLIINNTSNITANTVGTVGNGIIINNNLILTNGSLRSHIGTDYRYVTVLGNLLRTGLGFVDGELRKNVATANTNQIFEVGHNYSYTPLEFEFTGNGGTAGLLSVISDTITTLSSPVSWSDEFPSDILPINSSISPSQHIARQFRVGIPAASTFTLGNNREYNATMYFINNTWPNGDLRNLAEPNQFDVAVYNGTTWIKPFSYGPRPIISDRGSNYTKISYLKDFGAVILGTPNLLTFFSRANGNWNDATTWSQQTYGGVPASTYPGEGGQTTYKAYIGDNNIVTLNVNATIDGNGIGQVVIDTLGTLLTSGNLLSGTGEFRMLSGATLGAGDANGINAEGTNLGNILTTSRHYNYNSHNNSSFIYTGLANQNTGTGLPVLPDSIANLTVNTLTGSTLTINVGSNVGIRDSLYILSGILSSGNSDIFLKGNFTIEDTASFTNNNRAFWFVGNRTHQTVTAYNDIIFNNLIIDKSADSSSLIFAASPIGTGHNVNVNGVLTFAANNIAYINLSNTIDAEGFPSYNQGEWTMTIGNSGSIARTGMGHIDGELRKYIPINNTNNVRFEVGNGVNYRPFDFNFTGSGGGEVAGYIGIQQIANIHPRVTYLTEPGYNYPSERMLNNYWRLTRPDYSGFVKGNSRTMMLEPNYIDPIDIPPAALQYCFDLAYWKGPNLEDWQRLSPPNSGFNNGLASNCGERDVNNNEATYSPNATSTSTQAYNISGAIEFAYTDLALPANNRYLLGDVIVAQQGPSTIHFYSSRSGNWTDPTTWKVGGYGAAGRDTTIYPRERLHVAHIGEGYTVTLDANIGNTYPDNAGYSPNDQYREQRLGSVIVEKTTNGAGHLAMGTYVIRASVAELHSGAILETGSEDGFPLSNTIGNIQQQYSGSTLSKNYNFGNHNNGNFIYSPSGKITATTNEAEKRYCRPYMNDDGKTITQIATSLGASFGSTLESYVNPYYSSYGSRYFPYNVFHFTAGNTYTIRTNINGGSTANTEYGSTVFIDNDFDGNYTTDQVGSSVRYDDVGNADITFTIPANTPQGTTEMRVFANQSIAAVTPSYCTARLRNSGRYIYRVQLNTLDNNNQTSDNDRYFNYTYITPTELNAGSSYNFIGTSSGASSGYYWYVWIDYNQDGIFQATERVVSSLWSTNPQTISIGTVPVTAYNGNTRMRVKLRSTSNNDACENTNSTGNSGEFEDYTVNITGATAAPPPPIVAPDPCTYYDYNGEALDYTVFIDNPNYVPNQVVGNGLPALVSSIEINAANPISTVTQSTDLTIKDRLLLTSGIMNPANVYLKGVFENNSSINAFGSGAMGTLYIDTNFTQHIIGTQATKFYNLIFNKAGAELVLDQDITINNALSFNVNKRLVLNGHDLTFGPAGSVTNTTFYKERMIVFDGTLSGGNVIKQYPQAMAQSRNFTFPIGVDTVYSPAIIEMTANYAAGAQLSLQLINDKHPQRLTDNILNKYWKLQSTGITNISTSSYRFGYSDIDINGDINKYIPGRYSDQWEINLGTNPIGKPSSTGIIITNENSIDGDWTAGEPYVYYAGRVFFSITSGTWNDKFNWSTDIILRHNGPASSYFPGQLYADDTVNIDGHTMRFEDSLHISIDSLRMGGTNIDGNAGRLIFGSANQNKALETRSIFLDNDNCNIDIEGNNGADTIIVKNKLINNSLAGVRLRADDNNFIALKFIDTGNIELSGTGVWTTLADAYMQKAGELNDTLIVNSSSYIAATEIATNYLYHPDAGVIRNNLDMDLYLSSEGRTVEMGISSGIDVRTGRTLTKHSLITNPLTTINIDGGDLIIGNAVNESLLYNTGTNVNISNGTIDVAGCFDKYLTTSLVDFTIGENGIIKVLTKGNTQADKTGFDISNASSSFSMSGGRIILANAGGTTPAQSDLRISTQNGAGMTGGTIQVGDSILTLDNTLFKIAGTTALYNLHLVNNISGYDTTKMVEEVFTIKNNWEIDNNHTFNLNGNEVNLGGNLTNKGLFVASPRAVSNSPWQLVINGITDQTIYNEDTPALTLYDLRLDKPSGNLILSPNDNSSLVVHNTLEFSSDNQALINAIAPNRYVEISPEIGSNPQVLRLGLGHIYGPIHRWINNGPQNIKLHIGTDLITEYRPLTFGTNANNNTAGYLLAQSFETDHLDIGNAGVNLLTNIQRYWSIRPTAINGFSLGTSSTFGLTTQYINSEDIRGGINPAFFEHFVYSPGLPDVGTWSNVYTPDKTDSTIKSTVNNIFGDYIIGEPSGVTFFSKANGEWNDPNTWSFIGYDDITPTDRIPNMNTDLVRIGNGRKVTLSPPLNPTVRSVIVEKYNGVPGYLQINGNLTAIRGLSFVLDDDCSIGIQHLNGIAPVTEGQRGAIQTNSRSFGISRYIFNSPYGSQNMGNGVPNVIKSVIVDNPSAGNKVVYLNTYSGISDLTINDTISIAQGVFNTGNRNINILNTIIADSAINDGILEATTSRISFTGGGNKYINLRNHAGIRFYNLRLDNSNISAIKSLNRSNALSHVYVKNNMDFNIAGLFILGDSVNLKIENTAATAITNFGNGKFIRTSNTSGMLIRKIQPGISYLFPVGSLENLINYYSPFEFTGDAVGALGSYGVRTSWGKNSVALGAHISLSSSTEASYIKRYWSIDSVSAQINGQMKFYYNDADLVGSESDMNIIGRWRPSFERLPGAWEFPFAGLNVNTSENYFYTDAGFAYSGFIGDWIMANQQAFRRIFYSRQNGNWNDENTWTHSATHSGPICGLGIFPNAPMDSVVVGGGYEVLLNVNNPMGFGAGTAVGTNDANYGILNLSSNILNGSYFTISNNSTLRIGSPQGISLLGENTGNIQTTLTRQFTGTDLYLNIDYVGTENQVCGSALPPILNNLTINNSGAIDNNSVLFDKNINVRNDVNINSGTADIQNFSISGNNTSSVFRINSDAKLRLGGTSLLRDAISGYIDYTGVNIGSIIEFYGTVQDISIVPTLMYDFTTGGGVGYGNLLVNSGNKSVTRRILVRRDLSTINNALLTIQEAINSLEVRGSILNGATIFNQGIIEIGE